MSKNAAKEYTVEELESRYNEVTRLYDMAEEILSTVESRLVGNPEEQLEIVEPLVNEVGDAVDVLAEEFMHIAESKRNKTPTKASKVQIEGALRRIFVAINEYQARVTNVTKKAHGSIMNIADPLVKKLRHQVEQVVVVFLEFIQISLQSLMNKSELDALKQRDSRIALMMHQMTLAQQG